MTQHHVLGSCATALPSRAPQRGALSLGLLGTPSRGAAGDAYHTSGPSPTGPVASVHLVGAGKVGRAFLDLLPTTALRLRGVTDSSGTMCSRARATVLDPAAIAAAKASGRRLVELDGAAELPAELAIGLVDADVIVDATPTDPRAPHAADARLRAALAGHGRVVVAAKDALARAWPQLSEVDRQRVHFEAALGGTGARLRRERVQLAATTDELALVANATTSVLADELARGASWGAALQAARARGLLEADPTLDLDGTDAATKLALVCALLWDVAVDPLHVARPHPQALDPDRVSFAASRGRSVRLVARARRGGRDLRVAWEELAVGSPLAVPGDRVAYTYVAACGVRLHVGTGIGAAAPAQALLRDVFAAAPQRAALGGAA